MSTTGEEKGKGKPEGFGGGSTLNGQGGSGGYDKKAGQGGRRESSLQGRGGVGT